MRRRVAVSASVMVLALPAALTSTAAGDPAGICPDGMILVPAATVPSGEQKDRNDNGLVCGKLQPDPNGGPDDRIDPSSIVDDS